MNHPNARESTPPFISRHPLNTSLILFDYYKQALEEVAGIEFMPVMRDVAMARNEGRCYVTALRVG